MQLLSNANSNPKSQHLQLYIQLYKDLVGDFESVQVHRVQANIEG